MKFIFIIVFSFFLGSRVLEEGLEREDRLLSFIFFYILVDGVEIGYEVSRGCRDVDVIDIYGTVG